LVVEPIARPSNNLCRSSSHSRTSWWWLSCLRTHSCLINSTLTTTNHFSRGIDVKDYTGKVELSTPFSRVVASQSRFFHFDQPMSKF
jgi:hypothetical protein